LVGKSRRYGAALFPSPSEFPRTTIDPRTLEIIDQVVAPQFIVGRITATEFENHSYVYLTGQTTVFRYIYEDRRLTLDISWNPGTWSCLTRVDHGGRSDE
jgi:hypothetical protein